MANRYFFDKRDMKRGFAKYGIIFLISFLPILLFNIFVGGYLNADWLVVLLDCVFLLVFVVIGNRIANKIFEKKDKKLEARRKAREEMSARKKQILEDSYKRIREEKKAKKEKVDGANADVEKEPASNVDSKKSSKSKTKKVENKSEKQNSSKVQESVSKEANVLNEKPENESHDIVSGEEKPIEQKVTKTSPGQKKKSKNIRKEDGNEEK